MTISRSIGNRAAGPSALVGLLTFALGFGPAQAQDMTEAQLIQQLMGRSLPAAEAAAALGTKARRTRSFSAKERSNAPPAPEPSINERPQVDLEIYFNPASSAVTPRAVPSLNVLGKVLASDQFKGSRFLIAGHTDAIGGSSYNLALSKRRAEAVRRYLISKFRIESSRLDSIGHGKDQLKVPAEPDSPKNRRVQVVNMSAVK